MGRGWVSAAVVILCAGQAHGQDEVPIALLVSPGTTCPDMAALSDALRRQGFSPVAAGAALFAEVSARDDGLSVELRDGSGGTLLYRVLPAGECAALAETVALLVSARVREVGSQSPDPPDPPPREEPARRDPDTPAKLVHGPPRTVELGVGLLVGTGLSPSGVAAGPLVGAQARGALVGFGLELGWLRPPAIEIQGTAGRFAADRFLLRLRAGVGTRGTRFDIEGHGVLEVEALATRTTRLPENGEETWLAARAGPAASASVRLGGALWFGVGGGVLLLISGVEPVVDPFPEPVARHDGVAYDASATLGYRLEI